MRMPKVDGKSLWLVSSANWHVLSPPFRLPASPSVAELAHPVVAALAVGAEEGISRKGVVEIARPGARGALAAAVAVCACAAA